MPFGHVVITGGTGALGRAVVGRLLEAGAQCALTWNACRELTGFPFADRVELHQVDVSDEQAVSAFYADRERVDASIHLVGGFAMAAIEQTTLADFDRMMRLNAQTSFVCCREAVKRMRRSGGGRIVNVSARPAVQPTGEMVAYSAAKGAVAVLTQSLAEEVRAEGILVNAVLPSIMDTPMNRAAMPDADFEAWPKVEEVAEAIAFLAGPNNTLTTGGLVPVYGRA